MQNLIMECEASEADSFLLATRWNFSRQVPTGDMEVYSNASISLHPEERSGWVGTVNDP
jgi:hypothetical protein